MHKREAGLGQLEDIPNMRDEPALQFDWEEPGEHRHLSAGAPGFELCGPGVAGEGFSRPA